MRTNIYLCFNRSCTDDRLSNYRKVNGSSGVRTHDLSLTWRSLFRLSYRSDGITLIVVDEGRDSLNCIPEYYRPMEFQRTMLNQDSNPNRSVNLIVIVKSFSSGRGITPNRAPVSVNEHLPQPYANHRTYIYIPSSTTISVIPSDR